MIIQLRFGVREGHRNWVSTLEELRDEGLLISGSKDKTVKIWNRDTAELVNTLEMPDKVVKLALLRDLNLLAIQFLNLVQIVIMSVETWKEVRRIECGNEEIKSMTVLGDGRCLATCKEKISIWDVSSGALLLTLDGHKEGIWCLHFLMNSGYLASGCGNGEIKLWNPTSGQLVYSFKAHDNWVCSMSTLSDDGSLVSCSSWNKEIKIWK